MKQSKPSIMAVMLFLFLSTANAQSSPWILNGNNVTDTSKLGSLNQKPVRFVTINKERMRLTESGNLGIGRDFSGISIPYKLTIVGANALGVDNKASFSAKNSSGVYEEFMWPRWSDNSMQFRYGSGGLFLINHLNRTVMHVNVDGNVGIGTNTPEGNLHVFRGSAGTVTANSRAVVVVENSSDNFINLLTPNANERGVLFGDNLNAADGGIIYTGTNQLQLRANGNVNRMIIDPDGNTGIDLDPINSGFNAARLQVRSNGNDNLRLVAADNVNDWTFWSENGAAGDLHLFKNGAERGFFDAVTGVYTASDKRLKKDITALPGVLESVMKLQPKKYHFKQSENGAKYSFGFIAQEVQELFPEFVKSYKDRKTGEEMFALNYDNFGVIAIKAIQEQQKEIEELKALVDKLTNALSTTMSKATESSKTMLTLSNATLEQNKPNPFASATTIQYYVPVSSQRAQLAIYDSNGKIVKQVSLNAGKGTVNINASSLSNGTYSYSIVIDNKTVESKTMIVAH
jgi:hypothetical protein